MRLRLSKDYWVVRHKGKAYLYSPLTNYKVFELTNNDVGYLTEIKAKGFIELPRPPKGLKVLINNQVLTTRRYDYPGFFVKKKVKEYQKYSDDGGLGISLTSKCQLRCRYCYSSTGKYSKTLEFDIIKRLIGSRIETIKKHNLKTFLVTFTGGGEPAFEWDLLKKIVGYTEKKAKTNKIKPKFVLVTNGILFKKQIDFLKQKSISIIVSFDGLPESQKKNRPLAGGKDSFPIVFNSIKYMDKEKIEYHLQSVISEDNYKLSKIIEYIFKNFECESFGFILPRKTGRCNENFTKDFYRKLFKEAQKAIKTSKKYNKTPGWSFLNALIPIIKSCGAVSTPDDSMITPKGYMTRCCYFDSPEMENSQYFVYAKYNPKTKRFDRLKTFDDSLKNRNILSIKGCQNCIAKWHCAGGCPIEALSKKGSEGLFDNLDKNKCWFIKKMITQTVKNLIDEVA